jgi:hypothetical protein
MSEKTMNETDPAGSKIKESASPQGANGDDNDTLAMHLPRKSYEYAQLNLAVAVTQDIYNALLKSLYQVGIAEAIAVSNIYVVENAITPLRNDRTDTRVFCLTLL